MTSSSSSKSDAPPPKTGLNRRQHQRYDIAFPVTLRIGTQRLALSTANVSITGLFIDGGVRARPFELVRVEMFLPPRYPDFLAHGMAIHCVTGEDPVERGPGLGIQLYALDHAARERWSEFIAHVSAWRASSRARGG